MRIPMATIGAGLALLIAGCGSHSGRASTPIRSARHTMPGAGSLAARFGDIPQKGQFLGTAKAPFTLVWFADPQCPFCARFDRYVLPSLIRTLIRPGRLRLQLREIAFLGPASGPAAAATAAA